MARKLPAHIVLPNGMWRFVKSGSKSRARKRGSGGMAKKKKGGFKRGSGFGLGRLLSVKNLALTGGAVILGSKLLGVDNKLAGAAGGFMGAGIPGAIAGYFAAPFIASISGGLMGGNGNGGNIPIYG